MNKDAKKTFFQLISDKTHQEKNEQTNLSKFKFGMMKGIVKYMSDDFDEPISEFKDYM